MESELDQSDLHSLLSPAIKLLIVAASLTLATLIGFYLHPHFLPFLSDYLPQLWHAVQGWLTAPVLFLLLNLVVGTLYFCSSMLSHRPESPLQTPPLAGTDGLAAGSSSTATNGRMPEVDATPKEKSTRSVGGLRARIENSRSLSRLVRSKSEQLPPLPSSVKVKASGSHLRKAGTFEATAQSPRKPMVIVADPPEDDSGGPPAGTEEVDKKAEDFISRFYQKVKLQRLDSYLKNQQVLHQQKGKEPHSA